LLDHIAELPGRELAIFQIEEIDAPLGWPSSKSRRSMRRWAYWRMLSKLLSGRRSGSLSDTTRV